jgi:hypothetical protein
MTPLFGFVAPLDVADLFAVGIGCDIAGAYLLARGLLVAPEGLLVRFTYAGLLTRFVEDAQDRVLAVFGVIALIAGFAFQAVGYALGLAVEPPDDKSVTQALVAVGLAGLAIGVILGTEAMTHRRRLQTLLLRIAAADTVGEGPPSAPTVRVLVTGAPAIGVERNTGESDEAYARRAFGVDQVRGAPTRGSASPIAGDGPPGRS